MNFEYMIYPIVFSYLNNIKETGSYYDYASIIFIFILYKLSNSRSITIIQNILDEYLYYNKYTIEFTSEEKNYSLRYKALMHFLSYQKNESIFKIKELSKFGWDSLDEFKELNNWYQVDQKKEFKISENIYGKVFIKQTEKHSHNNNDRTEYKNINILKIYSDKYNLQYLQNFVEKKVNDYNIFLKEKSCRNQLLINVSYNTNEENIVIRASPWESTVSFKNSHFRNKKKCLEIVDNFLNNKDWFEKKGQPYNLGILLYGEPGGGKTRFIKQLLNYTNRHGININLNDQFNFDDLRKIIFSERIGNNYIIPQKKRILIFEDIDAVGESLHSRDKKDKKIKEAKDNQSINNFLKNMTIKDTSNKNNNNNLSYILGMFDGLDECSGRIIIMTTNKPEILDKALLRPGRIDLKLEFKKCNIDDIYEMSKLYWENDFNIKKSDIRNDLDEKFTSAEIINKFRSVNNFNEIKKELMSS